jgi:hypothetical protein
MALPHESGQLIPLTVTFTVYVSSGAAWTGIAASKSAAMVAIGLMFVLLVGLTLPRG